MKSRDTYLLEMLSNHDVTFYIPPYQRNYEWNEEQCEAFLDDAIKVTDLNYKGIEAKHFFGTIVYTQNEHVFGEPDILVLTDGQQRITTTMLCLAAIRDLLDDQVQKEYITNRYLKNNNISSDTEYKIKLKQVETDWESYKNIILNLPISNNDKKTTVYKNYSYFKRRLKNEIETKEYTLSKIIELGLEKFNLVTIQLEPNNNFWENPQEIFESMNSLGKPLSLADLVRNYILLGKNTKEQEVLYRNYWLVIENNISNNISNFIRDYMQLRECDSLLIATEKNFKELYSIFKKIFSNVDIEMLLNDLREYSFYYAEIISGVTTGSKSLDKKLNDFRIINVTTLNSFLMELLSYYHRNKISEIDLAQVFDSLIIYLLRRRIMKMTQGENKTFPKLIKNIPNIINAIDKRKEMFSILSNLEYNLRLPNDFELKNQLETMNFYNFQLCKFILALIEESITKSRPNLNENFLQIEHIMPQTLSDDWISELGINYEEVQQKYLNNIGNLTLIRYNQTLGNKTFDEKKKIYINNSGLQIAKDNIVNNNTWNENTILYRAKYLINILLNKVLDIPFDMKNKNNYVIEKTKLFSLVDAGLLGKEITYISDNSIKAKVVGPREVEFEGKIWKLSPLVRMLEERNGTGNLSGSYQGNLYWEYDGKPINTKKDK